MIWKNPFLSKNSEQQFHEEEYLARFNCTVLEMIEERNLSSVSYVSSTPGAGKTSLFRAFTPGTLEAVVRAENREEYREIYQQMERLNIVDENRVLLASAIISCARNYSILDEMFQNGRRMQILFALLNYRIAIILMRNIGSLMEIAPEDYHRITFRKIPDEMLSEEEYFKDGKSLYRWACDGERRLCRYLDSERTDELKISFVHTTLLMIKLFEPENIQVDGKNCFHNVLLIFDDFHKLSDNQRYHLSTAIYTLKSTTGVWFGQRLEGEKNKRIVSMDGSLNRDYNPNIVIDNYWFSKSKTFYKMLENIADRRVKEAKLENCTRFLDCLSEKFPEKKYEKKLKGFIKDTADKLKENKEVCCRYQRVFVYLDQKEKDIVNKAIWYECIIIQEQRRNDGQLSLFLGEQESVEEFEKFVKENRNPAWFYICDKCEIPFYTGMEHLKIISSYNIEQFLVFAGAYFETYRVKSLGRGSSRRQARLTEEEQDKILRETVRQRWEDMDYRYKNIQDIKNFLVNIAKMGIQSKKAEKACYAGGAYTGIALYKREMDTYLDKPGYEKLLKILGACTASKYLERRESDKGDQVLFYLNRWICVYFGLPLAYGGFKRCSLEKALSFCEICDSEAYMSNGDDVQLKLYFE